MNKNDPRTNLLLSLKPYMREGRKHSIDSAVRLFGAYKRNKNAEEILKEVPSAAEVAIFFKIGKAKIQSGRYG